MEHWNTWSALSGHPALRCSALPGGPVSKISEIIRNSFFSPSILGAWVRAHRVQMPGGASEGGGGASSSSSSGGAVEQEQVRAWAWAARGEGVVDKDKEEEEGRAECWANAPVRWEGGQGQGCTAAGADGG
eukprot:scaffold8599_cov110-Isochrysis_galbana.AAC.12